jgi:rhodanese-related sulfurtransferase
MNVAQMVKSAADMVKEAKGQIENLTPVLVKNEMESGSVTIIDIREPDEVNQNGGIPGSINAPRGMLEFYADASLPYHKPEFKKESRIILQCASGGRSALAVVTLKQMGYTNVAHLDGGFKAWKEAGLPVSEFA